MEEDRVNREVRVGQCWVHEEHVLLVTRRRALNVFECAVLHDDSGAWLPGDVVLLGAGLIRENSKLFGSE